ncbi:MAG: GNAT family N-acetyltransferase [Anaerolineaceae bacterium]|nr:GNAT family N-acetyltransferase [Anaerolineaceae bacterium]
MDETQRFEVLNPENTHYRIRPGTETDLVSCRALDHSYASQHVWQLAVREESGAPTARFHQVRLPRPLEYENLPQPSLLQQATQAPQLLLVAEEQFGGAGRILAYLTLIPEEAQALIRVTNFVVTRSRRGEGIGSQLLSAAESCSRTLAEKPAQIQRIRIETQSSNMPAIRYFLRHGFVYSGYDEQYYANGEIALFFTRMLTDAAHLNA